MDSFKAHINKHLPKDILDLDEFLRVRQDIVSKPTAYAADPDDDVGLENAALGVDEPPGLDAPPGIDSGVS